MKIIPLLFIVATLVGCGTPPPAPRVKIESDPPGARIFFGEGQNENQANPKNYIGTAPCEWLPPHDGHGHFKMTGALVYSMFVAPALVIVAEPPSGSTNLFKQRLVYHQGTIATGADEIPSAIFFDLTKPSPSALQK